MQANTLHVSIDVESEIRKITQRQYLNAVHYLVQLVRHALLRKPRSIRIRSTRRWVEIHQDGQPFDRSEWDLLTMLLLESDVSEQGRQNALAELEMLYGIAILSVFLTFPSASLVTRNQRLVSSGSGSELAREPNNTQGYTIRIRRDGGSRRQEHRELEYFCSGAPTPIFYNRKPINKAIELHGQLLTLRGETDDGTGVVGIPYHGDMCKFEYFKNGVRIGMKQYLPLDGRVFHGLWSSTGSTFEPFYRETITAGDGYFSDHAQRLYEFIGEHFEALSDEQRSRIKALLMGLDVEMWYSLWADLPFFASSSEPFVLSLTDLLELKERYGAIPCVVKPARSAPRFIPCLTTEDTWFLKSRLHLPLQLYVEKKGSFLSRLGFSRRGVSVIKPGEDDRPKESADLSNADRAFLSALNDEDPWLRFHFTSSRNRLVESAAGHTHVYLPVDSEEVKHVMQIFQQNPEQLPLLRYILVDIARRP